MHPLKQQNKNLSVPQTITPLIINIKRQMMLNNSLPAKIFSFITKNIGGITLTMLKRNRKIIMTYTKRKIKTTTISQSTSRMSKLNQKAKRKIRFSKKSKCSVVRALSTLMDKSCEKIDYKLTLTRTLLLTRPALLIFPQ